MPQPRYVPFPRLPGLVLSRIPGWWAFMAALALLGIQFATASEPFSYNPVQELRQALKTPVLNTSPNSPELDQRRNALNQRVAVLCRIPELREALLLQDWRDQDAEEQIAVIDRAARLETARRFEQTIGELLRQGDSISRLTAANNLSEVTATMREARLPAGTLQGLGPILADLVKAGDPVVREAAARALGKVDPNPALAVSALSTLFEAREPRPRRVAAEGLVNLVKSAAQRIQRRDGATTDRSRAEVLQVVWAVAPVACNGLADPDVEVRRLSVEGLHQSAMAIRKMIGDPRASPFENPDDIEIYRREVNKEWAELGSVASNLKTRTGGLIAALHDADPVVRFLANQTYEEMAAAWQRLQERAASLTPLREGRAPNLGPSSHQPLGARLQAALPALTAGVGDPDVRARRSAVDALEALGDEARPAASILVRALNDRDVFVRWAAARTLGKMAPVQPALVVPALALLLEDTDLDVRLTAAAGLRRFGSAAGPAVPALTRAAGQGDAEMRLAALQALEGVGLPARSAVPILAPGLKAADVRVRVATARLLGQFGPVALEVSENLRSAMRDRNPGVRRTASDALLDILPPPAPVPVHQPAAGQSTSAPLTPHPEIVASSVPLPAKPPSAEQPAVLSPVAWQSSTPASPIATSRPIAGSSGGSQPPAPLPATFLSAPFPRVERPPQQTATDEVVWYPSRQKAVGSRQ